MIGITNLSHMTLLGWGKRYSEILNEFGYSKKRDVESAKILNSLLKKKFPQMPVAYNAAADIASWEEMKKLFSASFQ